MNLLVWSAVLIVAILPCDGQLKSLAPIDLLSCPNQTHDVPLFSSKHLPITFDRTELRQKGIHTVRVHASIVDGKVAEFRGHGQTVQKVFHLDRNDDVDGSANIVHDFELHAKYINRTYIRYSVETINGRNQSRFSNCTTVLMISQPQRWLDKIFKGSIPFIVIFISVQMGMLLDIDALKEIMRRPVQIVIGFVCQYGFMPLIAFGISKIFRYDPLYGLGLFVVGCCPGGSASNQWTVMFDGDLNLSAFMSFASTVASFFMMPLWLYTLGQYAYLRELKLRIPFVNLAQSLLTIIGPLGIGMLIIHFFPKLKPLVQRVVKPILLMLIIYFTVFGAFVNWYLFLYIDLRTALTAPFLPWLGFLLGGFFAWVCGQDPKRIVTIGIETGRADSRQGDAFPKSCSVFRRHPKCRYRVHGLALLVSSTAE